MRDLLGRTVLVKGMVGDGAPPGQLAVHLDNLPGTTLYAEATDHTATRPGCEVFVAVRPEDLELKTGGDGAMALNELGGTIEALLFVGDHYECRVKLGADQAIFLHTPRSMTLTEGAPVRVYVAPAGISVWPV